MTYRMLIIGRVPSRSIKLWVGVVVCGRVGNRGQIVSLNFLNDFNKFGRFDGLPLPGPSRNLQFTAKSLKIDFSIYWDVPSQG